MFIRDWAAKLAGQGHAATGEEPVTLMVSISGNSVAAQLEELGADIKSIRNNVAIVAVAPDKIEAMAQLPGVISIEQGREQSAMMYFARQSGNADAVLDGSGDGLSAAYTGKGVVTGLMDQGIDPNHVAFYNDDQTENRVKAVYTYMSRTQTGSPNASYVTPDQIAGFRCDNSAWTHGTHVAAIMAGGYNGISNFGLNHRVNEGEPMPYYGLASGSDIVMTGGYLYDSNILDGVEKVIDYARSVNKPAVVNLSLGSTAGPHDGTSAFSRYLAGLGEDAIIVVAAGNEGDTNCALNATFNRLAPSVMTGISIIDAEAASRAEFWYSTSDAFKFEFLLCNRITGATYSYELPEAGKTYSISTSDETFGSAFASGSTVMMYGNVDPNNNRYYVRLDMALVRGAASNNNIVPAVRVTGATGKKLAATWLVDTSPSPRAS
ncbi:MAG: S8 family serine peptidase, partial [Muribaculaceae bacterium]|nr:S8 family serine peptidase [Muribaculaceae bacterium]